MANLQVTCLPKIDDLLWLQGPDNQHRSYDLFNRNEVNHLTSRRCATALYDHINSLENQVIPEEVFKYIRAAGFEGMFKTNYMRVDHHLIAALVERWRPETHTFHFPTGEATVTLQDVQVIWGLPIDGPAVSGTWAYLVPDQWIVMCQDYLGFVPEEDEELKAGKLKISTLIEHLDDEYAADEDAYQQRARIYILAMIAGNLFVDSNHYDVSLNLLENIEDLSIEGRKSWGSAAIAWLYRNLCKATHPSVKGIQGPLLLLQYWAWIRMPRIAPRIVGGEGHAYQYCYATRWNYNLSHTESPAHVMGSFRSVFTALTDDEFRWTPYDDIIHLLPEDCRSGQDIWAYSGWVIYWSTVEPHLAHRVARQFGYIQAIPVPDGLMSPQEHVAVHAIRKSGGRNTDWVHRHQRYIADWNNRHNRVFHGVEGATTTGDYMQWYYDRTVLCVTNPAHRGHPNQYPTWGSEQQLFREGFREISDRARNLMEREPTQSHILQDFVRIPRDVMQMTQTGGRMSYSSQNFQFPSSAYHQGAPSGGYHHGGPTGGYHDGGPSGGYQQGTFGSSGYHQGTPGSGIPSPIGNFFTPSQSPPLNMFGASSSAFAPDFAMDARYQHLQTGREMPNVTPIPMRRYSVDRYATTNLATDDDGRRDTQLPLAQQRGRRENIPPPRCGTGGHRRHQP